MNDNQIFKEVRALILNGLMFYLSDQNGNFVVTQDGAMINAGLSTLGIGDIAVKQSYQPTMQGAETGPTVYLFKVADRRRGSPRRESVYDPDTETFIHTETTAYETTFQASALVTQNPANVNSVTASDLINYVSAILQSEMGLDYLQSKGLGILRIGDVRNLIFENDRQQFQAQPSFDFILTHNQVIVSEVPAVISTEYQISRV